MYGIRVSLFALWLPIRRCRCSLARRTLLLFFGIFILPFGASRDALGQTLNNGQIVTGNVTDGQTAVWGFSSGLPGQYVCASVNPVSTNQNFYPGVGFQTNNIGGSIYGNRICSRTAGSASGQILVKNVKSFDAQHPMTYSYTVELATPVAPFDPSNGGQMASSDVVYNGTTVGHNVDLWRFAATANDFIQLKVFHQSTGGLSGYNPWAYIVYPDGVTFQAYESGSNGVATAPLRLSQTGLYVVFVYNQAQTNGNSYSYQFSVTGASSPATLPNDIPGDPYSYTLTVPLPGSGANYTWSVINGNLPAGLKLDPSGYISNMTSSFREWAKAPLEGTPYVPKPGVYQLVFGAFDGSVTTPVAKTLTISCGDAQRDALINQYLQYVPANTTVGIRPFPISPKCSDFTNSASTANFSFSDLTINTGSQWALLRKPLLAQAGQSSTATCPLPTSPPSVAAPTAPVCPPAGSYGLDAWVKAYEDATSDVGSRKINSAYRTPAHNASIHGAAGGRHMFGDAVDLNNNAGTEEEWHSMKKAAQSTSAWIEPRTGPCGLGCVHADWRWVPGKYQ